MDDISRDLSNTAMALGFAGFVLVVLAAASAGAMFKPGAWYETLIKPSWTPPKPVFPIAWAILYFMIAVAGWLAWRAEGFAGSGAAFSLYLLQLILNAAWSWLFFGLHRMDLALIDIVALGIAIVANIIAFHSISPLAAYLLIPYLLWVIYATALNLVIWQSN